MSKHITEVSTEPSSAIAKPEPAKHFAIMVIPHPQDSMSRPTIDLTELKVSTSSATRSMAEYFAKWYGEHKHDMPKQEAKKFVQLAPFLDIENGFLSNSAVSLRKHQLWKGAESFSFGSIAILSAIFGIERLKSNKDVWQVFVERKYRIPSWFPDQLPEARAWLGPRESKQITSPHTESVARSDSGPETQKAAWENSHGGHDTSSRIDEPSVAGPYSEGLSITQPDASSLSDGDTGTSQRSLSELSSTVREANMNDEDDGKINVITDTSGSSLPIAHASHTRAQSKGAQEPDAVVDTAQRQVTERKAHEEPSLSFRDVSDVLLAQERDLSDVASRVPWSNSPTESLRTSVPRFSTPAGVAKSHTTPTTPGPEDGVPDQLDFVTRLKRFSESSAKGAEAKRRRIGRNREREKVWGQKFSSLQEMVKNQENAINSLNQKLEEASAATTAGELLMGQQYTMTTELLEQRHKGLTKELEKVKADVNSTKTSLENLQTSIEKVLVTMMERIEGIEGQL